MVARAWSNHQAKPINQRLMPLMAPIDGIIINIWKNRKIHSNVNIMCQKPPMGQLDSIIETIWKNRKVHSDENLKF